MNQTEIGEYNALALQIYTIIKAFCYFPTAIIKTQCKRINKTPGTISANDLAVLAPEIGRSVAMFTNPLKGQEVEKAISALNRK